MKQRAVAVLFVALALASCTNPESDAPPQASPVVATGAPVPIDHHVHILSSTLVSDWKSLGVPFSKPDEAYVSAAGLLGPGGREGEPKVDRAFLVSMAHFYGSPEMREALGLSLEEEQARVRRENEHVAAEAARYPKRAVAFCSVSVLRPYADEELEYCFDELGFRGLKIHVANSGVDLRDERNVSRLGELFDLADRENATVLLHLDPQMRGHETKHIRGFIEHVLEPHPTVEVVIAHLGGSGGYGAWTESVFETFIDWIEERKAAEERTPNVWFDLSAVVLEQESEGVPPTTDEEAAALMVDLRRLGLIRVVFGSDYPVFQPVEYAELLQSRLSLSPAEMDTIKGNRVPVRGVAGK